MQSSIHPFVNRCEDEDDPTSFDFPPKVRCICKDNVTNILPTFPILSDALLKPRPIPGTVICAE